MSIRPGSNLKEVRATTEHLKEQVVSKAQELKVVQVDLKRASMALEPAREEQQQLDNQVSILEGLN